MHIADGVLSVPVLMTGMVFSVAGVGYGLQRLDNERIPQVAVLSAAFFVASLIHLPIGFSSVHLVLNGLLGIILGWAAFPALAIALFLQVILFGFGGISALGVNIFNMAFPAVITFYLCNHAARHAQHEYLQFLFGFIAGSLAILLSTLLIALSLFLSGEGFIGVIQLIFIAHFPVMIVEGVMTGFIVVFLRQVRPELLTTPVLCHATEIFD
jgi:cobalt/nickel transport system permease protein